MMRRKAFTLVELLVVISIIGLLMSILMPVLAKARQFGKNAVCLSNLRQIVMCAFIYTNANDDYFPMAVVMERRDGEPPKICAWDFTNVPGQRDVEPGLLWQGEMLEKIQQCPVFKGPANWSDDPYTGYNYNRSYIGGSAAVLNGSVVPGTKVMSSKINNIRRPSKCAVFGDGQWAGGANKFMRAPFPGKLDPGFFGRYAGTQGYRHMGRTNVAWCDGSAKSVRKRFTQSDPGEMTNIAEGTGFLSEDNSLYDLE